VVRALRKGQARAFNITRDIRGEARQVERAFGLGASPLAEARTAERPGEFVQREETRRVLADRVESIGELSHTVLPEIYLSSPRT
jgi:hypothetical protein